MTADDEWDFDEIKRNTRTVNPYWVWKTDRQTTECGVARDVLTALEWKFEDLRPGGNPPDCEATVNGQRSGIEVTELVDQEKLEATLKGKLDFQIWDRVAFCAKLQLVIDEKDLPVKSSSQDRYYLFIHTDEMSLNHECVDEFLRGATFKTRFITDAFLALPTPPLSDKPSVFKLELVARS